MLQVPHFLFVVVTLSMAVATITSTTPSATATASPYGVHIDSYNHTVSNNQTQPSVPYSVVWADEEGATHVYHCRMEGLALQEYAPPAAPQWIGTMSDQVAHVSFGVLPVGYVGQWHVAPGPQFVVVLSGAWSSETSDGSVLVQSAGDFKLDADSRAHSRGNDTRVGHIARQLGDVPCVQLIIAFNANATVDPNGQCGY